MTFTGVNTIFFKHHLHHSNHIYSEIGYLKSALQFSEKSLHRFLQFCKRRFANLRSANLNFVFEESSQIDRSNILYKGPVIIYGVRWAGKLVNKILKNFVTRSMRK